MCSATLFYWKKILRALVSLSFCAFGIFCTSSSWQCFVNLLHYLVSAVVALYISILFAWHHLSAYLSISCGPLVGDRMLAVLLIASWLWGLCLAAVPAVGTRGNSTMWEWIMCLRQENILTTILYWLLLTEEWGANFLTSRNQSPC